MQLTDEQKQKVASWIAEGAKLSEVQQRIADEFDIRLTYMQARFLADDLAVVPKEKEPPKKEETAATPVGAEEGELVGADEDEEFPTEAEGAAAGKVKVSIDQIVRPGALVSGKVTLSDGVTTEWYIDQMGRFGLVPPTPDYKPSPEDLAEFRVVLEQELSRKGL